ncbi:FAD/FMN-containing dehydrogenase [Parasphingorhabdus marina DSM 22363]|uniref:FAD/FMN-containing dehydrogenase n=1 Tax=Parasphingorhabdus marina DSM 22363 TaxID=1123272 RepID=A0A1N6CM70_9SPHN|nr:FAD-binding oxidoreductase [Parasphingorhabdus marina]SIN59660.1 FAD/FMN-containing dehydrogenase [Parasphingorhabdus marina DSM 22363]
MPERSDWLKKMETVVGNKGLSQSEDDMAPWLTDWRGRYTGAAQALVSPGCTEEVAEIIRIAAEYRIAIVPQGGNSGMVGGATPDKSGQSVLLSLRRMNNIRNIAAADQLVTCDAGVILQNLHEALAGEGQRFPLTLGGKGSATVGGLVSTNAGGTQVLRHGAMRALVAGIEAVLPDGSIYSGLAPLKKDNRGYDLKQLLIGGEGTLGVVTAATLRTVPALIDRCVAWAGVSTPQQAHRLFQFLNTEESQALEGFEIVPRTCLDAVLSHIPGTRAPLEKPSEWNVLIEIVRDQASAPDPRDRVEQLLADAIGKDLILDAAIASSESQAEDFWKLRDSIAEAERAQGPALQHDISVPVSAMADFIIDAGAEIERQFTGTEVAAFGHMGDGNVHFHVKAPPGTAAQPWTEESARSISPAVHDLVVAAGGSISAEHGIGQTKVDELERLSGSARLGSLRAIKSALDPHLIMNPGKLVPLASWKPAS